MKFKSLSAPMMRLAASAAFLLLPTVAVAQSSFPTTNVNGSTGSVIGVVTECTGAGGLVSPANCTGGGGGGGTVNLATVNGVTINLGQTTMSASLPVALASNQTPVSVVPSTAQGSTSTATQPTLVIGCLNQATAPPANTVVALTCNSSGGAKVIPEGSTGAPYAQDSATSAAENIILPSTTATYGVPPVTSGATAVTGLVLKASAGNLYEVDANTTAVTPGFLVVINAATVPAALAAITPVECRDLDATGEATISHNPIPEAFTTGAVALLSTSCLTYTALTAGFIHGMVK